MRLQRRTVETLAEMICGAAGMGGFSWENFRYRSSYYLTEFFQECGLDYHHDGTTRRAWVIEVLTEINEMTAEVPSLPSSQMLKVIQHLADPYEFADEKYDAALEQINRALSRDGLRVKNLNGHVVIENLNTNAATPLDSPDRLLNSAEEALRREFVAYFKSASEDEFTEHILVRLFSALGFKQIHVTGHEDRSMEFGKDLWMKYRLPTGHQLYIGVQVKTGKIHASGSEITGNISGILAQLLMLMTYPVFDPETNTKHLFDHVFLVSSGEITKQARTLLSEFLDNAMRRNVMFLDSNDILDLCVRYGLPLPGDDVEESAENDVSTLPDDLNDIPF